MCSADAWGEKWPIFWHLELQMHRLWMIMEVLMEVLSIIPALFLVRKEKHVEVKKGSDDQVISDWVLESFHLGVRLVGATKTYSTLPEPLVKPVIERANVSGGTLPKKIPQLD